MEAYCVKCKTKREIVDPLADFNAAGAAITRGICGTCGTKIIRIGKTPAHEGLIAPQRKPKEVHREGKLVIVESPAKARTVGRFLGHGYNVKASIGHVRDLLRSELSVDVDNNFAPKYRVPNEKRQVVKELKAAAQNAAEVYLATDPDREGEAIAWHLLEAVDIDPKITKRVVFHEITDSAINESFAHPRDIDMHLVDAQQARRVLDRLVGYGISPLLWEKVRSRLSAGRVQSIALRLVVEREREINDFVPVEYWSISAELKPEGSKNAYIARLTKIDDHDPELPNEATVHGILTDMQTAAYLIKKIKRSERRRKPSAPFTTSTMQQEASRRLGYTAKRTMAIAQQLYEGIDVGTGGVTGLITYMRTDSTNVAEQAQDEARNYIQQKYGNSFIPDEKPVYRTSSKSAQEAHEAIRPTSVLRQPEAVKEFLSRDQYRLYQLIWQRFVASQMSPAVYDTVSVEVEGKTDGHLYALRATGSTLRFQGFLAVYEESLEEDQKSEDADNVNIPPDLEENQKQNLERLIPEQHFTQPPPRYSDATLIKTLEEFGIGRPSTYAAILSTIQDRGYVIRDGKKLFPTDTGFLVNDMLVDHFPDVVNTQFTAGMEEELDQVASGERQWTDVVRTFYDTFAPELKRAEELMPTAKAELEKVGRACPECGHDLVIRWGRYGKFISCSNFPACRYTEAWLEKIGVHCPKCDGEIVERKTRKNRVFYGCANYPECDFTSWKRPLSIPCPKCGGLLLIQNKREAQCEKCQESFLLDELEETAEKNVEIIE